MSVSFLRIRVSVIRIRWILMRTIRQRNRFANLLTWLIKDSDLSRADCILLTILRLLLAILIAAGMSTANF